MPGVSANGETILNRKAEKLFLDRVRLESVLALHKTNSVANPLALYTLSLMTRIAIKSEQQVLEKAMGSFIAPILQATASPTHYIFPDISQYFLPS